MLKYIEYLWLTVAIGLMVLLVWGYKEMNTYNMVGIIVGMGISAFMFSFRRRQRKLQEQREQDEEARLRR